jgi:hypothetical protein
MNHLSAADTADPAFYASGHLSPYAWGTRHVSPMSNGGVRGEVQLEARWALPLREFPWLRSPYVSGAECLSLRETNCHRQDGALSSTSNEAILGEKQVDRRQGVS